MILLDWNMTYQNLSTLINLFKEDEPNIPETKFVGPVFRFDDLPQIIPLTGITLDKNVYASVSYQSDQDDGEEPDEPITEAYVGIRIVENLPEEKSRAEIVNAEWRFTAEGIEQVRGEMSDLMVFFEMLPNEI